MYVDMVSDILDFAERKIERNKKVWYKEKEIRKSEKIFMGMFDGKERKKERKNEGMIPFELEWLKWRKENKKWMNVTI